MTTAHVSVLDLEQSRSHAAPWHPVQHPGFHFGLHRRHPPGAQGRTSASGLVVAVEHFATHVDAFCHQAYDGLLFDEVRVDAVQGDNGFSVYGAETIEPFVGRGVLIDIAKDGPLSPNEVVERPRLEKAAEDGAITLQQGDVVLVRTGWGRYWDEDPERYPTGPGMCLEASRWLADHGAVAVGADNMAWEPVGYEDDELGDFPSHVELLVKRGIYIFENLALESLSRAAPREFLFVAAPLKVKGATAGPVRPLAIVAG